MKHLFERTNIQIRTWLWERRRSPNRVLCIRDLSRDDRLTFNPYQSDYEYLIDTYCKRNASILRGNESHPYVFKVYMTNGTVVLGFPVKLSKKLLTLRKEKSEADGYHTVLTEEFNIYLFEIEQISAIHAPDDFQVIYAKEPIFGYKAIEESNGKLCAKGHMYRLNEPNVLEIKNPYETDFQDCYFHFCTSIEGVALCPGPTDYLMRIKNYTKERGVIRLFRVKAEEHCVQMNGNLGWCVTNKLTVLEEVSKEEIYKYYMENPRARDLVTKHYELPSDFWEEFRL